MVPAGINRVTHIFMIVVFAIGIITIVGFLRVYPEYWFAGALFLIIAVVGIIKRIAILRGKLPADRAPVSEK